MSETRIAVELLLREARCLHEQGRINDAERIYDRMLELEPTNFEALHRLAIVALQQGALEEALCRVELALRVEPGSARAMFNRGTILFGLKRHSEAHDSYQAALQIDPDNADALFNLGNVQMAQRRYASAADSFERALSIRPHDIEILNNHAAVLTKLGRLSEALSTIEAALRLEPDRADMHFNYGTALKRLGRTEAALESYDRAIVIKPRHAGSHNNRGAILLDAGRAAEALDCFDRALALGHTGAQFNRGLALIELDRDVEALAAFDSSVLTDHERSELLVNRGTCLLKLGRADDALAVFDELLTLDPNMAKAHYSRGVTLVHLRQWQTAIASFERAIVIDPNYADAHMACGVAHASQGRCDVAVVHLDSALQIKPHLPTARVCRCMAELPILYPDEVEISRRRAAYRAQLEALSSAVSEQPTAFEAAFDGLGPFYLAYQGCNDRELQSLYGSAICRAMANLAPAAHKLSPPPQQDEPIRVGVVSAFFRSHSNWNVPIHGWLTQLDRRRFKLLGYHTDTAVDRTTDEARALFDRFVEGARTTTQWRDEILADRLHVLIYPEIGMWPATWRLAAMRLAPVQCTSWGHPTTSGFPTIDYFLTSDLMEPPEAREHYSEELVRLPNLSVYFDPLPAAIASIDRANLGFRPGATIYWCAQSLYKYLPQFDCVFARIASEVPNCQFVFVENVYVPEVTGPFLQRLEHAFAAFNLRMDDYCIMLPVMPQEQYRAAMGQSDVFLDSIAWSGCNTILEALIYDLPIVTLPGPLMRSRHGKAILDRLGLSETIASSLDSYVAIAARLSHDHVWRNTIRSMIARRKHRIYRDRTPIVALEQFLIKAVTGPPPAGSI